MSTLRVINSVERDALEVREQTEGGSDMERLASALHDLAGAVRPLIDVIKGLTEDFDNLRQAVEDLDQRVGRVEEVTDGLPSTLSVYE